MSNRIKLAVAKAEQNIKEQLENGITTQKQVNNISKGLDMPMEDFCLFQKMKSQAYSAGLLNLEEANYVYSMLGETPETFNKQPLEVKHTLSRLLLELTQRRLKNKALEALSSESF